MKKRLIRAISIALALCMSLSLVACGGGNQSDNSPSGSITATSGSQGSGTSYKGQWIRNTSSSMGGIWYPIAVAMNLIWEENLNGISCKVVTGSSTENVRLVAKSETAGTILILVTLQLSIQQLSMFSHPRAVALPLWPTLTVKISALVALAPLPPLLLCSFWSRSTVSLRNPLSPLAVL